MENSNKKGYEHRCPKIMTWDRLKQELKEQFLLNNMSWLDKEDLKKLKRDNSVRDMSKISIF